MNLGLTYRRTGIGTIARISYPGDANGEHAVFLFPVCPDGMRTLDVTGIFSVSDVPGGPDQWDQVAASVNPCSTEPAPTFEITPAFQALAMAFLDLSTASNDVINRAHAPLAEGAPVKVWNRAMKKISQARRDIAESVLALPWTPELLPLAQAVADANRALADNEQIFVKAKKARQLENNLDTWSGLLGAAREPAVALRLALGLATTPR